MRIVVFQHLGCEHPGIWRDFMREDGIEVATVELDAGDPIPSLNDADALLVFGGPMNVDQVEEYPWLRRETEVIGEAAVAGKPILGVCLGGQLLAKALGAAVTKNPEPEVGLLDVDLTEEGASDPLFAGWPRRASVVQWHSDTFALPQNAIHLASSPACRNQAFRYGDRAYGLQFHPEVTPDMVLEWEEISAYAQALHQMRSAIHRGPFDELGPSRAVLAERARRLFDNFVALIR